MAQTQPSVRNDEQIARSVQKGDKEAFGLLAEKYETKIKNYIRRFIQEQETVNDIAQNVFLKAFSHINSFNTKLKFSTWLYRIAHNELVNFLKKKKELPLLDFDVFWPRLNSGKQELEDKAEKTMLAKILEQCLEELPARYKEVIVFYYLENMSYGEIAEILRAPLSTVGVRLKRAKDILKKSCDNKNIWKNQQKTTA
ncbi:MAG: RNA polymerase sigma factor [Candidatus Pacebacteria bacterium]|nr:RNA polymerase sigma factor [Candidatus Paceibacterota bacterium]